MADQKQPLRQAATILVARDTASGPEVYMVQRSRGSSFFANAHVFVGGRLDEGEDLDDDLPREGLDDAKAAARLALDDGRRARALYVAALRESFEESGLLVAREQRSGEIVSGSEQLTQLRDQLNGGALKFSDVLRRLGAALALDRVRYLAHWITPELEPKRYDTRFFVCPAPESQKASCDGRETTSGGWFGLNELLDAQRREQLLLAPPTICVLEALCDAGSVEELLAAAPDEPVEPIQPRPHQADGELQLLLPGDHRFAGPDAATDASAAGPLDYVVLRGNHWEHVTRR